MKYMSENVACIILQHIIHKSNSIRCDTTYSHLMDISEHITHTVWVMLQQVTCTVQIMLQHITHTVWITVQHTAPTA
jgi:hypothetical protein